VIPFTFVAVSFPCTIERAKIRNVKVPDAQKIAVSFINERKHLIPRHTRDFQRLVYLIKAHTVLNFANRNLEDKDITANQTDVEAGIQLYSAVCESNELGLDPATYETWTTVIRTTTRTSD
jgi:hypothetical protein